MMFFQLSSSSPRTSFHDVVAGDDHQRHKVHLLRLARLDGFQTVCARCTLDTGHGQLGIARFNGGGEFFQLHIKFGMVVVTVGDHDGVLVRR